MTQITVIAQAVRLLALACALLLPAAVFADDYADVNQLLHSGKYAEALAKADQYIAAKPRDPQMRFLKGVVQTVVPPDRFDRLHLDQRDLPVRRLRPGIGAGSEKVAVAFQSPAGDRVHRIHGAHSGARGGRDMEGDHPAGRHGGGV
jgi:hypothetical protein